MHYREVSISIHFMADFSTPADVHVRKFQKELASGLTALVLLAVLAESAAPMYGYQIAKRLEEGAGVLRGKQSALYPVLRNLDATGLAESEIRPSHSGPPRRYYRITELGRQVLAEWRTAWVSTCRFVDELLQETPS